MQSGVKIALGLVGAGLMAGGAVAAPAQAAPGDDPYAGGRNYVKTLKCPVRDPWPGAEMQTRVDVWNKITHPSDGLPPPAIALIASTNRWQLTMTPLTEYTMWTRVYWRNVDNKRRGVVKVRTRATTNTWQAVLHPGAGRVKFEIHQSVEAMFLVPGLNPQTSVCRGSAQAV
ncbi:hypothetical protein GOARA_061_00410 [Gordonia araii NBRC 100433]|uniref:Secreted protein n=1 Tax=Gordonia araii NBRC 100433 TaxID=1073574 RepID=G7H427_9ACTN|nr:hypothetical protein [Gordonia araii]NNG96333.1 hypothetical protein [Gordonia araii NBRC 100433]GAB10602.1 hypothetical protein GOARA_061_00410 [Gordonia araii NBRC 100433]